MLKELTYASRIVDYVNTDGASAQLASDVVRRWTGTRSTMSSFEAIDFRPSATARYFRTSRRSCAMPLFSAVLETNAEHQRYYC